MQEREQKWDARHEDDKLWGAGITNMIAKVMKGVPPGQEAREKKRHKPAGMDGRGLEASQHVDTTQEGGPEKRQQLQQQPETRLPLIVQAKLQHEPKPMLAPTPARRWETVPPRTQSQKAPIVPGELSTAASRLILKRDERAPRPGPVPTSGSSIADRRLILRRDESIRLPRRMDEEIASAVNRELFQQQAPAHVRIMNARRNAKGTITAITHQNATAEMALLYRDIIIKAARSVDKRIMDVEGNESWERLTNDTVPLVRYMGKGTEGLHKMREEIQAENEGVEIPAQVRSLSNPQIVRDREQRGEIKASSVVFIVMGKMVAQRLLNKGIIAAGERYKVELYMNAGPNSLCELCCGWGHIESKCSHHQLKYGYWAGPHRSSEHRCNLVGCASKQGAVCGHTQEKCPNCKGNHIAFSGKYAKKIEAITMARQSRKVQPSGRETREVTGANRVGLGTRQARDITNGEGEPTADEDQGKTGEMEMEETEVEKEVTISETTAEIEM
jgi:hypothetical protein